jgi:hypothetical protein
MKQLFYLSFAKLPKMILRLVLRYDEKVTANLTKNYCEIVIISFAKKRHFGQEGINYQVRAGSVNTFYWRILVIIESFYQSTNETPEHLSLTRKY